MFVILKKAKGLIGLFLLFFLVGISAVGQDIDQLSKVNVDDLSDQQIKEYMDKARLNGVSDDQLEKAALARGMAPDQIEKLKNKGSVN